MALGRAPPGGPSVLVLLFLSLQPLAWEPMSMSHPRWWELRKEALSGSQNPNSVVQQPLVTSFYLILVESIPVSFT